MDNLCLHNHTESHQYPIPPHLLSCVHAHTCRLQTKSSLTLQLFFTHHSHTTIHSLLSPLTPTELPQFNSLPYHTLHISSVPSTKFLTSAFSLCFMLSPSYLSLTPITKVVTSLYCHTYLLLLSSSSSELQRPLQYFI